MSYQSLAWTPDPPAGKLLTPEKNLKSLTVSCISVRAAVLKGQELHLADRTKYMDAGADPTKLIEDLAKRKKIKTLGVSMGQGQEIIARKYMAIATVEGQWVLLQNTHLGLSYLSEVIITPIHHDISTYCQSTSKAHVKVQLDLTVQLACTCAPDFFCDVCLCADECPGQTMHICRHASCEGYMLSSGLLWKCTLVHDVSGRDQPQASRS